MATPLDNAMYNQVTNNANYNQTNNVNTNQIQNAYKNAMKNPQAFEEYIRRANPNAYNMAVQLSKSKNPKDIVMQILNSKGINPSMFGL